MTSFSIIITSHNQARFIRETVDSALAQSHSDKEIIVVDDASTDGSQELLTQYGDRIRLHLCRENHGPGTARNLGAFMAHNAFLVFLDGDDVLLPWALNIYARTIDAKHPCLLLGTLHWCHDKITIQVLHDAQHRILGTDYEVLLNKNRSYRGSASATVVERDLFLRVDGWSAEIFPGDVEDLMIKLCASGRTIVINSPPTVGYRIHSTNTVHQVQLFVRMMEKIVGRENAGEYVMGRQWRFRRRALIGGPIFFWAKRSIQSRNVRSGFKLLISGRKMIGAAIAFRIYAKIRGQSPIETIATY